MKRLVLTLAATLAVAGPLASSDMASAKDRHGGGWQQNRGGENRGGDRGGGRWRDGPDRGDPRGEPRGYPQRGDPRGDPRGEPQAYPRDPRAYAPPDERVIQDHARYRLRPPPRGYSWVRMGNGSFALIQQSTGQVFDVIPGR